MDLEGLLRKAGGSAVEFLFNSSLFTKRHLEGRKRAQRSLQRASGPERPFVYIAKHKVPRSYSHPNRAKAGALGAPDSGAEDGAPSLTGTRMTVCL